MASEAQINQKRLDEELTKPLPDGDIVYALRATRPYWNTIDTDKIRHGFDKLRGTSLQRTLERLVSLHKSN